jgi:uracil-DNA glycosylase
MSRRPAKETSTQRLVADLSAARLGATFNQYRDGPRARLLRERLAAYLERRAAAPVLLVGEAAGHRGTRVSGLPFTSERQLTGRGPAEATATIVHRVLAELELDEHVLLWNVVPTHPGTPTTNRAPRSFEIEAGLRFAESLSEGRFVVAVGRVAERALGAPYVRHPSRGGAQAFRAGLVELLGSGTPHPA